MTTEVRYMQVSGVRVAVVRKAIKNLHLGVYPPMGRVRVAAPLAVSDAAVRVAVIGKLRWIRRQQASFADQPRESPREMVSGESHFFLGRHYRLMLVEGAACNTVLLRKPGVIQLGVRPGSTVKQREQLLQRFYREQLNDLVPGLVEKWQSQLGVDVAHWGVKKMKTKWGSCNAKARRIWLNLELAKKPVECLEYLVVHELVHLRVRHHDTQFHALMNQHLPRWKSIRRALNAAPLAHDTWGC